jgi:hypothetical protein
MCEFIIGSRARTGESLLCGKPASQYEMAGGLASVPTTLCQKHTAAVAKAGYSLEVLPVVPVFTVDLITQPGEDAAASTSIVTLTNEEPVQVSPLAAEASDSQRPGDMESNGSVPADACGEAASETQEPGTSAAPASALTTAEHSEECLDATNNANEDAAVSVNPDTEQNHCQVLEITTDQGVWRESAEASN